MDSSPVSMSSTPSLFETTTTDDDDVDIVERDPTGQYVRYDEILGEGASKTVYKAFDEVNGIEVAWNQIELSVDIFKSETQLQKVCAEANLLKSLKHENVIRCFHSWVDTQNKTINMITELFTSGNLRLYRNKHGQLLDYKAIKNWARQILKGLDYLHSHKPPIVHRDLKCENIFVNGYSGKVKIGDLGLATVLQHATAHSVIGTPEFMAPELYEEDYDQRVDIYSFGMCMLQMVTRELPYSECKNSAQIYKKVSSGIKPAALDKVMDPQVREFIEKCLAPVSERVSAIDLLKDSFLVSNVTGIAICSPNLLTESLCSSIRSSCENHTCIPPPPPVDLLKVAVTENNTFKLGGKIKDEDSVSMTLWIADLGSVAQKVDFPYFIKTDTLLSVAEEMAKELELSAEDVALIVELMDELILELVPGHNAKPHQKFNISKDDLIMSNMPAKEPTIEDQGLQQPVPLPPTIVEQDPARESEYELSSSKDSDSSQSNDMSFCQDQKQKHIHDGRVYDLKYEESLNSRRKYTRKNHKDFSAKLQSCFRKLLFRCRNKF